MLTEVINRMDTGSSCFLCYRKNFVVLNYNHINEFKKKVDVMKKLLRNISIFIFTALIFAGCFRMDYVKESIIVESTENSEFTMDRVPYYSGNPFTVINNNITFFTEAEMVSESFEYYSELDEFGRCGETVACVGKDIMPTKERGEIGSVKPTGWHLIKYDCVDGKYLYNRCHLIGYQLTGENDNINNLITGTRYLNVEGMLPFENMVADYVKETGNHVMYRVTPVFEGDNLLASGVLMEALSVEDSGEGIQFNVYCYNVQPGVKIDYATGESVLDDTYVEAPTETVTVAPTIEPTKAATEALTIATTEAAITAPKNETTYMLNTNTMKFHKMSCSAINSMNEENKLEYTGTRDEVIAMGYDACGICKP